MRSILVLLGLAALVALLWLCLPNAQRVAPVADESDRPVVAVTEMRAAAPLDAIEESVRTQEPVMAESAPPAAVLPVVPDPKLPPSDLLVRVVGPDGKPARDAHVFAEMCVQPERYSGWATKLERVTDADGCTRLALSQFASGKWILVRATAEPSLASPERLFTAGVPSEVTLKLGPAHALRVVVRDDAGRELEGVDVTVAKEMAGTPLLRAIAPTRERGNAEFELPPGCYDVSTRAGGGHARARETVELYGEQTVALTLVEEKLPLAVSGTVVDEVGRPIAGATVRSSAHGKSAGPSMTTVWFSVGAQGASVTRGPSNDAVTDANGRFEIRRKESELVEVHVDGDPLYATFEPSPARVAYGATDVVLRRTHAFRTTKLRVRVIDDATKKPVRTATLGMRIAAADRWQWRTPFRGGWADAVVPERADATWRVEAPGYFAVENTVADLLSRARDGVVELALVRDLAAPADGGEGALQFFAPR